MVDRGADRLGKRNPVGRAAIVERGGNRLLHIDDIVVAEAIEFFGCYGGLDVLGDHFQHLGRQAAGHAHAGNIFRSLDGYCHEGSLISTAPQGTQAEQTREFIRQAARC